MMINAQLVRDQRSKRGWTQQQMAEVADLSLRTVQRIENQGLASNESVSALSAVLELPREQLMVNEAQQARRDAGERRLLMATTAAAMLGATLGTLATLLLTGNWGML